MRRCAAAALVAALAAVLGCSDEESPRPSGSGSTSGTSGAGGGPDEPGCEPGEALFEGACRPAGVPPDVADPGPTEEPVAGVAPEACAEGFVPDGDFGCEPILPAVACPVGTMAVPGDASCSEPSPCAAGTWGDIPVDATTQHVDASYPGADSDGTAAKPWPTIQQGIDAAVPGAIVAIAGGTYAESAIASGKSVRIWGRCPALVEIVGQIAGSPALEIVGAPGSEVRAIALTGSARGLLLTGSPGSLVEGVWMHDLLQFGLVVEDSSGVDVIVRRSLIENITGAGLVMLGSHAQIEEIAVRDTYYTPTLGGYGLEILVDLLGSGAPSIAHVSRSIVERTHEIGIGAAGSLAVIEGTVVRDTLVDPTGIGAGWAVIAEGSDGLPTSLELRGSLLERSIDVAAVAIGATLVVEDSVVRDTEPAGAMDGASAVHGQWGPGGAVERGIVDVRRSVISGVVGAGVTILGDAECSLDGVLIRDVRHGRAGFAALGVSVEDLQSNFGPRPRCDVTSSIIEDVEGLGLAFTGADGAVVDSVVRDTTPAPQDAGAALGVYIAPLLATSAPSDVTVSRCRIERTCGAAIYVAGSTARVEATAITDIAPLDSGYTGVGISAIPSAGRLRAYMEITGCLVERGAQIGIVVAGADADIHSTLVRDMLGDAEGAGEGIAFQAHDGRAASGSVRWSAVERSHSAGIAIWGASAELEGVRVADVQPNLVDGTQGIGVGILPHANPGSVDFPAELVMRGCAIERVHMVGVAILDASADIETTLVRDVLPQASDLHFGRGINTQGDSTLTLRRSAVDGCRDVGVLVQGGPGSIQDTRVSHTGPRDVDGTFGDGITIDGAAASGDLVRVVVDHSARSGISAFGSTVRLADSTLECNGVHLDGEATKNSYAFDDLGGNVCGCEAAEAVCTVTTTQIAPPEQLPP